MVIKRNNPGNIRKVASYTWDGELPGTVPGDFITFYTIAHGYRAMIKQLQTYISRGINTISECCYMSEMVTTYAPPNENPTASYIDTVAKSVGINPDKPIAADDIDTLSRIAYRMSMFEHGVKQDDGTLITALNKAKDMLKGFVSSAVSTVKENPVSTGLLLGGGLLLLYIIKNKF